MVGFSAFLSNGTVLFLGESGGIGLPEIRISDGSFPVFSRQGEPQFIGGLLAPVTNVNADNFPCVPVDGKPNPLFFIMLSDERPQFVTFDSQAAGFFFTTTSSS